MLRFAAARARQTAIVTLVVTSLAFLLVHTAPGDPFATIDTSVETAAARADMRVRYGLDLPLYQQYPAMLLNFARGEFGTSFSQSRPVSNVLAEVIPDTLIGGAAIVEDVFAWPGAGHTLVAAVGSRDYPLVIALVTVGSIAVCVGSALADAAAAWANPSISVEA